MRSLYPERGNLYSFKNLALWLAIKYLGWYKDMGKWSKGKMRKPLPLSPPLSRRWRDLRRHREGETRGEAKTPYIPLVRGT